MTPTDRARSHRGYLWLRLSLAWDIVIYHHFRPSGDVRHRLPRLDRVPDQCDPHVHPRQQLSRSTNAQRTTVPGARDATLQRHLAPGTNHSTCIPLSRHPHMPTSSLLEDSFTLVSKRDARGPGVRFARRRRTYAFWGEKPPGWVRGLQAAATPLLNMSPTESVCCRS